MTKDFEGNPRPVGAASDMGAYEAGAATPVPALSVTPASLAFGTVNVGSTEDLTVTVRNAGGGTLTGSASTTAPFSVVGTASYRLAANQTKVVTVRFSPPAAGAVQQDPLPHRRRRWLRVPQWYGCHRYGYSNSVGYSRQPRFRLGQTSGIPRI